MSHKHHTQATHSRERKRAEFAQRPQRTISPTAILVIVFTALLAVALYLVLGVSDDRPASTSVVATNTTASTVTRAQTTGASEAGEIVIPISDVNRGKAKFFDYTASNKTSVRFFVIKSSDGVYRAALDACDVCYAGKQGYYQNGDDMICKKCGRDFPSALVNEVSGGCNPIGLRRTIDGDRLVIRASELESRKSYF